MAKRPKSTTVRAQRYGIANQMAHETEGRIQREALKASMAKSKAAARAAGTRRLKSKASERGMNAGTMGGSRIANAWFSSARTR